MATKDKEHKHSQGGAETDKPSGPPVPEVLFAGMGQPGDGTANNQALPRDQEKTEGEWTKDESGARKFMSKQHETVLGPEANEIVAAEIPGGLYRPGEEFQPGPFVAVASTEAMISELRAEMIGEIGRVRDQLRSEMINDRGLQLQMVGGIFNCPDCGLRLNSPSLTGMKGGLYEHGFQTSPQLGGVQCKYKGRKFKPPVAFLEFADQQPLTAKAE